jgi:hypothetical protein
MAKNQINISPALLIDLQKTINTYGYKLVCSHINAKQGNHRYIFTDGAIKLLIEFSEYKKL